MPPIVGMRSAASARARICRVATIYPACRKHSRPAMGRAAYFLSQSVLIGALPVAAREEAEQRENEDHDQENPQNVHAVAPPFAVFVLPNGHRHETGTRRGKAPSCAFIRS